MITLSSFILKKFNTNLLIIIIFTNYIIIIYIKPYSFINSDHKNGSF